MPLLVIISSSTTYLNTHACFRLISEEPNTAVLKAYQLVFNFEVDWPPLYSYLVPIKQGLEFRLGIEYIVNHRIN